MRNSTLDWLVAFLAISFTLNPTCAWAQDSGGSVPESNSNGTAVVVGHAFSATKYARRVRVLSDGKQQFTRNERYPAQIARDAKGRLMMQSIGDDLASECDQPTVLVPPPCPSWTVFVIDPVKDTVVHWTAGKMGAHEAVEMPLSRANLDHAALVTSEMPEPAPEFDPDGSNVSRADLGEKVIEGISVYGTRTTIVYAVDPSGDKAPITRIHEVWTAPEMRLIVRVVDGDPHGLETVWGLEKISLQPDPSLFKAPDGYEMVHRDSDKWADQDFEAIESWFSK